MLIFNTPAGLFMDFNKLLRNYFLIPVCFILLTITGYSQTDTTDGKNAEITDSSSLSFQIGKLSEIYEKAIQQVVTESKEKQIHSKQLILLDQLEEETNKAIELFKRGIDTLSINQETMEIKEQFRIASEGTITGNDDIQTIRNLNTSVLLMNEIVTRLKRNRERNESLLGQLNPIKNKIDSLQNDTILFKLAKDTVLFKEYWTKLLLVVVKLGPVDSNLTAAIRNLRESGNFMANLEGSFKTKIELIEEYRQSLSRNLLTKDVNSLFETDKGVENLEDKFNFSYNKASLVLNYYLVNNLWRVLLLCAAFIMLVIFILKIRKRFRQEDLTESQKFTKVLFDHPVLSSAVISLTILQFIFPHPPVIFSGLLWTISAVILTVILWKYFSGMQRIYWIYLVSIYILTLIIDLLLKESGLERWLMLFISISAIIVAILVYMKNAAGIKTKKVKFLLFAISLLMLAGSVFTNLTGRYNLSKIYLTMFFFALMTGLLLYWVMILSTQLMYASAEVYKSEGNQKFQKRIRDLKDSVPVYLKFILIIGWIILVARNLYFYDKITSELILFMEEEISIGDFRFSFEKLLIFIFIVFISAIISKAISFYGDSIDNPVKPDEKKISNSAGLSNWMLLIRIAIISIGTIIAFAATGLPIDKLTIIIGSLGLGIGLGLQSIVNNLVSGIMLAFEKPFKIGDYIQIGDESGRIKEIGIRSSKLSTTEGADIIIPNGDLLSKHVLNWTLRDSFKRSELNLNIKYGSQLNEIRSVFQSIMENNMRINKTPPPVVLLNHFSNSSAEYRLMYWTHIEWEDDVKSELIISIEDELKKAGIELSS